MDAAGAGPCCMGVSLSNRKSVPQTRLFHAVPEMEPSRGVRVQLCACRRRAERPGRPRSCRQGRTERVVAGLRPKEGAALTAAEFGRGVARFGSARVRCSIQCIECSHHTLGTAGKLAAATQTGSERLLCANNSRGGVHTRYAIAHCIDGADRHVKGALAAPSTICFCPCLCGQAAAHRRAVVPLATPVRRWAAIGSFRAYRRRPIASTETR